MILRSLKRASMQKSTKASYFSFYFCYLHSLYIFLKYRSFVFLLWPIDLFFKINFFLSKSSFRKTIRVSNSLDLDQYRRFVGPDLGVNYLQRL